MLYQIYNSICNTITHVVSTQYLYNYMNTMNLINIAFHDFPATIYKRLSLRNVHCIDAMSEDAV